MVSSVQYLFVEELRAQLSNVILHSQFVSCVLGSSLIPSPACTEESVGIVKTGCR